MKVKIEISVANIGQNDHSNAYIESTKLCRDQPSIIVDMASQARPREIQIEKILLFSLCRVYCTDILHGSVIITLLFH